MKIIESIIKIDVGNNLHDNIIEFNKIIESIKPNRRVYVEDNYIVYYAEEHIFKDLNIKIDDFTFHAQIRNEVKIFNTSILPKQIFYGFTSQYDDGKYSNVEEYNTTDLSEFISVLLSNNI